MTVAAPLVHLRNNGFPDMGRTRKSYASTNAGFTGAPGGDFRLPKPGAGGSNLLGDATFANSLFINPMPAMQQRHGKITYP